MSNIQSIYAYFSVNEKKGLDYFFPAGKGTLQQKLAVLPPVNLVLANGAIFPWEGKIETASGLINAQTGAINMRAAFPNPDRIVRSGSSAVIRLPQRLDSALLIPQKATYQIQGKLFAYLVDSANTVNSIEIVPGYSYQDAYVVTKGLKPGDRIVADGISSLREGLRIHPITYSPADRQTQPGK